MRVADDVGVGQHEAIGRDDDAAAGAIALATRSRHVDCDDAIADGVDNAHHRLRVCIHCLHLVSRSLGAEWPRSKELAGRECAASASEAGCGKSRAAVEDQARSSGSQHVRGFFGRPCGSARTACKQ